MKKIKVVIVEDIQLCIDGYLITLKELSNVEIIAVFKRGKELIDFCKKNRKKIDLLLLDVRLPDIDGVDALMHFKKHNWNINTIMVSEHYDKGFYDLCKKKLGLKGYIPKRHFSSEHFNEAVNFINNNETYFVNAPEALKYDDDGYLKMKSKEIMFSEREKEFIPLLGEYTFNEIAEKKGVSISTVKTTISRAKGKFDITNNIGLVKLFLNLKRK